MVDALTIAFADIGTDAVPRVGGKANNLGALTRAGVRVPPGFCVTTSAFDLFIARLTDGEARFAELDALDGTSVEDARAGAERMRAALEAIAVPDEARRAIVEAWRALGPERALAVRSSATAEDLPGASFAGQQDTYLNVRGEQALIDAVRRCWISLFTDRAVLYRSRGHFGHRSVKLAVVVQRLVDPEVSGILFTADPLSGHRHIASIDAGFGLGEALVGGLISADLYSVDKRTGEILLAKPGDKAFAIRSAPDGGTRREALSDEQRRARALTDEQARALTEIGARIEAFYGGAPQDIEWCIGDGVIYVVQARPITSLFPIPEPVQRDDATHIFVSFGHLQMMPDAMPRLAQQVWQLFLPAGKAHPPTLRSSPLLSGVMVPAAGRLYVDVTGLLRVARLREPLLRLLTHAYEALGQSIITLAHRPSFLRGRGNAGRVVGAVARILGPVFLRVPLVLFVRDPDAGAAAFTGALERLSRGAEARIHTARTPAERIRRCTTELHTLFWRVRRYLSKMVAGFIALALLKRSARGSWADSVRGDVDVLMRGLPGNVTTEMDLAVGDLTDLLRPHPELAQLLRKHPWKEARDLLGRLDGGAAFAATFESFLARYGRRGASEIDLSRPRWQDDPALLLRAMLGGLSAGEAATHRRHFATQISAADDAASRLIAAAGQGVFGPLHRRWVRRLVRVARAGMGLREHPKFLIVQILGMVRSEVLAAAALLVKRGQLAAVDDVFHLGFDELASALDDASLDLRNRVTARAAEFTRDQAKKAPIAISSEGEVPVPGGERADLPKNALAGTGASAGVVEGIARVVTDPGREILHAGEILVAPFTDPGWTPLFVHAVGLVTEVGGMMTHGAVVAREYGIPAVVSVPSAVERIKTGQRIRVDGTRGFVEILEQP